jgi:hypothetical protein
MSTESFAQIDKAAIQRLYTSQWRLSFQQVVVLTPEVLTWHAPRLAAIQPCTAHHRTLDVDFTLRRTVLRDASMKLGCTTRHVTAGSNRSESESTLMHGCGALFPLADRYRREEPDSARRSTRSEWFRTVGVIRQRSVLGGMR